LTRWYRKTGPLVYTTLQNNRKMIKKRTKLRGLQSASELYRPSDRRMSAK
jgi:hypothetical protein